MKVAHPPNDSRIIRVYYRNVGYEDESLKETPTSEIGARRLYYLVQRDEDGPKDFNVLMAEYLREGWYETTPGGKTRRENVEILGGRSNKRKLKAETASQSPRRSKKFSPPKPGTIKVYTLTNAQSGGGSGTQLPPAIADPSNVEVVKLSKSQAAKARKGSRQKTASQDFGDEISDALEYVTSLKNVMWGLEMHLMNLQNRWQQQNLK